MAGVGGDLTGGAVTVRVLANAGTVTLSNATTGPLTSGVAGNPTVPWSDIAVTGGALAATTPGFTNAAIAHPPFNTGAAGGATATPTTLAATAGLVRREGSWTFAYANTATLPAGTYGDTDGQQRSRDLHRHHALKRLHADARFDGLPGAPAPSRGRVLLSLFDAGSRRRQHAFTVSISGTPRSIYLQVGVGG